MSDYLFTEGIPNNLKTDYSRSIFHEPAHLKLQSLSGWASFGLLDAHKQILLAEVHFHINDSFAKSPLSSPFGSFLFSEKLSQPELLFFVSAVIDALKTKGVNVIVIKNSPQCYYPKNVIQLEEVIKKIGFKRLVTERSACILIEDGVYANKLHGAQRWRLNKAHRQKFSFEIADSSKWTMVYKFLKNCRDEKKYELSMTQDKVGDLIDQFPNRILLPVVLLGDEVVAAALCIRVYDHVLYTFYYDHNSKFNAISPVILLIDGLYSYCKQNSIAIIDLGTAMVMGSEKKSLMDFKLNLGAKAFDKNSFEINLYA